MTIKQELEGTGKKNDPWKKVFGSRAFQEE